MTKKLFFIFAVMFLMYQTAQVAQAQQIVTQSTNAVAADEGSLDACPADPSNDYDMINEAASSRKPAGCLLMECWSTCNIPGVGNQYETNIKCGNSSSQSLRTSCSLAGGTITKASCRPRGYSSRPCAPAQTNPTIIPGPLPW